MVASSPTTLLLPRYPSPPGPTTLQARHGRNPKILKLLRARIRMEGTAQSNELPREQVYLFLVWAVAFILGVI